MAALTNEVCCKLYLHL